MRDDAGISARDRPTRLLIYDPKCEMAHRQEPFSLVVLNGWPLLGGFGQERATRSQTWLRQEIELTKGRSSATRRSFPFWEDCYARFHSHGHYGVPLSHS